MFLNAYFSALYTDLCYIFFFSAPSVWLCGIVVETLQFLLFFSQFAFVTFFIAVLHIYSLGNVNIVAFFCLPCSSNFSFLYALHLTYNFLIGPPVGQPPPQINFLTLHGSSVSNKLPHFLCSARSCRSAPQSWQQNIGEKHLKIHQL